MSIDNPYAPPASDLAPTVPPPAERPSRTPWVIGFAVNLIVPTLFAAMVLAPLGWLGMIVAALTLLMVGLMILKARPAWTWGATTGAFLVAATQLLPMLQMMVGAFAVGAACVVTGTDSTPFDDDADPMPTQLGPGTAFLATTLGGLALMAFSLVVGLAADAFWVRPRGRSLVVNSEEIRWCE